MKKTLGVATAAWILCIGPAVAGEMSMSWKGTTADTIELAPSGTATVQIRLDFDASGGATLLNVAFANEAAQVTQTGATTAITGWTATFKVASFGSSQQQVTVGTPGGANPIDASGSYVIVEQTIRLDSGTAGELVEITFDASSILVVDGTGGLLNLAASESAFADLPGFVHLGMGSPGYTASDSIADTRQPLKIRVAGSSSGDGGGGTPGDGGSGDGDNPGDGGSDPGDGDGDPGDGDPSDGDPDDGDPGDGGPDDGDDGDPGNGDPDDGDPGDGDPGDGDPGGDDGSDPDDGDGGDGGGGDDPGDDDGGDTDPGDDGDGDGGGGNGDGQGDDGEDDDAPRGICGVGLINMLPFTLLGALAMRSGRRR
jgi:hypothetical protein